MTLDIITYEDNMYSIALDRIAGYNSLIDLIYDFVALLGSLDTNLSINTAPALFLAS
jgi:hypothetical protein